MRQDIPHLDEGEPEAPLEGFVQLGLDARAEARLHPVRGLLRGGRLVQQERRLRECLRRLTALGTSLAVTTAAWQNQTSQALLRAIGFRPVAVELAKDLKQNA